jgi:hypothetical protein
MSDIGPYGVTQHADGEMVTANALVGGHAGNVTENQTDPRFSRAMLSTAPYKKPGTKEKGVCAKPDCRGLAKLGTDYCRWHQS